MTKLSVPNYGRAGCQGVDMPDGTRYDVNRQGKVDVDDRHVTQLLRSGNAEMGAITVPSTGFNDIGGERVCGSCGFRGMRWQKQCPRCDRPLPKEVAH